MAEALSEREQRGLAHLRKAQVVDASVAENVRSFTVVVGELYSASSRWLTGAPPLHRSSVEVACHARGTRGRVRIYGMVRPGLGVI